jgi:hypothetical protein
MNPRAKPDDRVEQEAKVRDVAVSKLAAKGHDVETDTAVGPALQRALRENA